MTSKNGNGGSKKRFTGMMNAEIAAVGPGQFEQMFGGGPSFDEMGIPVTELGPMNSRLKSCAVFMCACQRTHEEAEAVLRALERARRAAGEHAQLFAPQLREAKRNFIVARTRYEFAESNFYGEVLEAYPDVVADGYAISPDGRLGTVNAPDPQDLLKELFNMLGADPRFRRGMDDVNGFEFPDGDED